MQDLSVLNYIFVLGEISDIAQGFAFPSENFSSDKSEGLPLIKIGDIGSNNPSVYIRGKYDETYSDTFIRELAPSLARHDSRTLLLNGEERLLFWLQKANANVQSERLKSKAEATALACGADYIRVVLVTATPDGQILDCYPLRFSRPSVLQVNYAELQHDASRLRAKHDESLRARLSARKPKRPRPNEPCWCGSGVKYKRCHGLQRH